MVIATPVEGPADGAGTYSIKDFCVLEWEQNVTINTPNLPKQVNLPLLRAP